MLSLSAASKPVPRRKRRQRVVALAKRQQRYYERKRNGMVCVSCQVDPVTMAEFLHSAGVFVLASDRESLKLGFEELIRRFEEGRLRVEILRDPM